MSPSCLLKVLFAFIVCIDVFIAFFFFFQAEDGIRDVAVTGVQTCALPIFYRIRIVNSGPLPLDVSLTLEGSIRIAHEQRGFRVATTRAIEAGTTLDVACETDWRERFALVDASALAALLTSRSTTGRCELTATLH